MWVSGGDLRVHPADVTSVEVKTKGADEENCQSVGDGETDIQVTLTPRWPTTVTCRATSSCT